MSLESFRANVSTKVYKVEPIAADQMVVSARIASFVSWTASAIVDYWSTASSVAWSLS